ncbi:MAG: DUF3396 domain-containing protein [Rhodospirillales bacterium]|nr:DUF3396 domain-containing protein [Rhodospirillales bacterium]MDH3965948.1 DUF3396 domain-containing protein [Rhodospirillales bacterium]
MSDWPQEHMILDGDRVLVTPALSICVFFDVISDQICEAITKVWEHIEPIYRDHLRWYSTERMPYKEPVDDDVLEMVPFWFEPGTDKRSRYLFFAHGGESPESISPWAIELYVENAALIDESQKPLLAAIFGADEGDFGKKVNCLRLSFPADPKIFSLEKFQTLSLTLIDVIPILHGYAGYSLFFDINSNLLSGPHGKEYLKLAMRHPGYDVFVFHAAENFLNDKMKSVNWLTALGEDLTAEFESSKRREFIRDERIEVMLRSQKLLIKAGSAPSLGDVNSGDNLPLYRMVARAVAPLLCRNHAPFGRVFDEDQTTRWIERFDQFE